MKLGEARRITSQHLDVLCQKKRELTKLLKNESSSGSSFDKVEISKALSAVEDEYEQIWDLSERLSALDANIQNAEISRQQSEAVTEAAEEIFKILEVFRRIAKGDQVPALDEKKLMEYSYEMYAAAKNMALMNQNCEGKKHKSLWQEEPTEEEPVDPAELAANTEVGVPITKTIDSPSFSDSPASQ